MDKYLDRGIIKWLPFDGLVGFHDLIKDLKYRLGKKEKPILSEDQMMEMDYKFKQALKDNLEMFITYYEDGYLKDTVGHVLKLDLIERKLMLDNRLTLELDTITNIEICT
ncbi:MAG TPA: YolD-like family protein [Acholeplasma sp.]|jgi:hypothetical protein